MDKKQILDTLMLLSALESWSFSHGQRLPDYLLEQLNVAVQELTAALLR